MSKAGSSSQMMVPIFHACRFIINFQSPANYQKGPFTFVRGLLTWLQPSQFLFLFQCYEISVPLVFIVANSFLTPPSLFGRQKNSVQLSIFSALVNSQPYKDQIYTQLSRVEFRNKG